MRKKAMSLDAHDVQICVRKLLKLSAETFMAVATEYPLFSCSLLGVFLLYLFFPFVFWALVHSFPFVVCIGVVASWLFSRNGPKRVEEEEENDRRPRLSYGRVHSVRRRRPRELIRMQQILPEVERTAVAESNLDVDVVDKNALIEESPKEIREVLTLPETRKRDNFSRSFAVWEEGTGAKEKNKSSDVSDLGIPDGERTKRLESLIARRRLRKLLNHESAMKLMKMERNSQVNSQVSSLLIPRTSTLIEGDIFNSPGSAPSVLIPDRNPFDIPYDPHEEKPDLTGDSFQQEFLNGNARDFTYCRHESFSLGGGANSFCNEESKSRDKNLPSLLMKHDEEFPVMLDQESYHFSESKATDENPVEDQIKEVIQVHEIDSRNAKVETDDSDTSLVPKEGFCSGSSSSSSLSSTDNEPVYKIDKETILKSLYSMSRRSDSEEVESKEKVGESYLSPAAASSQLFRHGVHHHIPSYSIASDLEVEVSEVSSPPFSINDSISYQDNLDLSSTNGEDMEEKKITWDVVDIWTGSSHPSNVEDCESRSGVDKVSEADVIRVGFSGISGNHELLQPNNMEENLCSDSESPVSISKRSTNLDEKIFKTLEKSLSWMSSRRKDAMTSNIDDTNTNSLQVSSTASDNNVHHYLTQTPPEGALSSIEATENDGERTFKSNDVIMKCGMQEKDRILESALPIIFSSELGLENAEDKHIHSDDQQITVNSIASSAAECGIKDTNGDGAELDLVISVESGVKNEADQNGELSSGAQVTSELGMKMEVQNLNPDEPIAPSSEPDKDIEEDQHTKSNSLASLTSTTSSLAADGANNESENVAAIELPVHFSSESNSTNEDHEHSIANEPAATQGEKSGTTSYVTSPPIHKSQILVDESKFEGA